MRGIVELSLMLKAEIFVVGGEIGFGALAAEGELANVARGAFRRDTSEAGMAADGPLADWLLGVSGLRNRDWRRRASRRTSSASASWQQSRKAHAVSGHAKDDAIRLRRCIFACSSERPR